MRRAIENVNQLYWGWLCKNHPEQAIADLYMAYIEGLELETMALALAEDIDLTLAYLPIKEEGEIIY